MKRKGKSYRRTLVISSVAGAVALGVTALAVGAVDARPAASAQAWQAAEPAYPRVALPPLAGVAPFVPGAGDNYPRVAAPPLAGASAQSAQEEEEGDLVISGAVPWGSSATVTGIQARFQAAEERCTAGDVMCMVRIATGNDLAKLTSDMRDLQNRVARLERSRR